jgi:large subunit ribosomal protein L32
MALPKRRTSKARKRIRSATKGLTAAAIVRCPNCQEQMQAHHVCKSCGYYAGREVVETEDE